MRSLAVGGTPSSAPLMCRVGSACRHAQRQMGHAIYRWNRGGDDARGAIPAHVRIIP